MAIEDLQDVHEALKVAAHAELKGVGKVEAFADAGSLGDAAASRAPVHAASLRAASPLEPCLPRISVIIPARNEARNLPSVLAQLPPGLHEVILVDGHSTDGTIDIALQHYPGIRVVQETRPGKGNALYCGFLAATGDIIVTLDADGSANPDEIPRFVDALTRGADFAKGSRFLPDGGSSDITRLRALGNRFFTLLVNLLYGTRYTDLCYGYNAFWRRCLPALRVDCDGFEIETLINLRATQSGLAIREVGSFEGRRLHGVSNLNAYRDGRRVLRTILRERFARVDSTGLSHAWEQRVAASVSDLPVAELER